MSDTQNDKQQGKTETKLSRREVLKMAGVGGVSLLLGSVVGGSVLEGSGLTSALTGSSDTKKAGGSQASIPFYDTVQAGIVTPSQDFLCFASFDLVVNRIEDVRKLFREWTEAAAQMAAGQPVGEESSNAFLPPKDTGEAAGLLPARTTITFGVGPSFFDERLGLQAKRPASFKVLPKFPGDSLLEEWCGGDIGVQVCANDLQVAFHAIRNLTRIARGKAVLRWMQEGFQRTGAANPAGETPRNLLGFKDGTGNPNVNDRELMNSHVWVQPSDGPSWMENGSYMVTRRIRMRIEVWDRSSLQDQETTFGRHRASGAPLGEQGEFDPLALDKKDENGKLAIPAMSHVRLSHGDGSVKILRRSYSYSSGMDLKSGQFDAGLFFVSYQRNIATQFVPLQERLAKQDKLNEYIVHVGSAVFACFPGAKKGGYIGEGLLS
ncbi:iron uptake transporter deferrochelatase/peroxidase subunit [Paenibacillus spongiae]|uniref:Deferrochelatase n=1 Tax=Paenibacillus spongiae TaxID=2909671 RepID=A0ABY5SGY4_9BACL|nr:iron uptake transporter deferrochelatase/peroxidase subunit [Paenibacillus spongiae]UVI33262.1 iron uptake transporter deferrochelatase/peroxidase subunit [Paenibacillus spongiae]